MLHFCIITQNLRVSNSETKERKEKKERRERMRDREREREEKKREGREEKKRKNEKKRREIQNKWRNCSLKYITLYTRQKGKKTEYSWAWECTPLIPNTQKIEAARSL